MGKIKKEKIKKKIIIDNPKSKGPTAEWIEDETVVEGDHIIDGYHLHDQHHHRYFNDDIGEDDNDYEVEQERYGFQSDDLQSVAVDRYIRRIGKNRRTPR
tara:strand:- start:906 stop:1205 length:300 start_codon:yes stop_codon:yes gene_type:complete